MPIVADASVAIRGDMSGFHRDLKGAEKATQGFVGRINNLFSPRNLRTGAGLFGIGLGIRQLVGFAGDAASAFAELEQTSRTIDQVFGKSADTIREWGETAADTAGMSQQTFMSSAAIMGQTLQNMGFTIEESANRTVQLLQRAADLAIAYGKRPADALLAITAAMRGERDTIEKFGVAIKQVDVNAEIAALGLDTSTAAAKKNAEAIAVVNLVLDQSASSAGRFADSQDDLAARMATATAKWQDFVAVDVGGAVADIQLTFLDFVDSFASDIQRVQSGVGKFAMHFGEQSQIIQRLAKENGISWDEMHEKIMAAMDVSGMTFTEVAATFTVEGKALSDLTEEQYQDAALAAGAGVAEMATHIEKGGPVVGEAWSVVNEQQQIKLDQMVDAAQQAGIDGVAAFGGSILNERQTAIDEVEDMVALMESALSVTETIAGLTGKNTIRELKLGLANDDTGLKLAAEATLSLITTELNKLGPAGQAAARALLNSLTWTLREETALAELRQSALRMAGVMTAPLMRSEPKDPLSPMKGMTHWGRDYIGILSNDMLANLGTASAASRALAGALVPSLPQVSMAGSGGAVGVVGAGKTYILQVDGKQYEFSSSTEMVGKLNEIGETWG